MDMIHDAISTGDYIGLLYPFLRSTDTLVRTMGLDQIGDDVSLIRLQEHVQAMGYHRFEVWRAGPVNELHWQHRMIRMFGQVERLLPVMEHLQHVGELLIGHILSDSTDYPILVRSTEHSRKMGVLAHTDAMLTWRYVTARFRDHLNHIRMLQRASVAAVAQPPAQVFEDVHIRLTAKEYRTAITSMRGALKRRKDPKVPDNCAICLDPLLLRRTWHGIACGHVFHPKCLKVWMQTQCRQPVCPLCRYDVRAPHTPKNNTTVSV